MGPGCDRCDRCYGDMRPSYPEPGGVSLLAPLFLDTGGRRSKRNPAKLGRLAREAPGGAGSSSGERAPRTPVACVAFAPGPFREPKVSPKK